MLLKEGSSGPDVQRLQSHLGINPDGNFGPATKNAVKAWQKAHGLLDDGIVGDGTWGAMFPEPVPASSFKLQNLTGLIPQSVLSQIPDTAVRFNITTPLRLAHFLAQCALESGGFKWTVEFASGKAYEGRADLGNTQPGDGVKYKGRGFVQLTGRANYAKFSNFINEDCVANPELVATKYPLASAGFFFNSNGLWKICDRGSDPATVLAVTKRVNGGTNGLAERQAYFDKFWPLLK